MSFKFINLHTHHLNSDSEVLSIVNQYPNEIRANVSKCSMGIHPWHIDLTRLDSDLETLRTHCFNASLLAIGECGLDKRINQSFEIQMNVFQKQLALAQEFKKPVIIHCVGAFQEVIAFKKKMSLQVPLIIHGYSKGIEQAKQLIQQGFYLSFGKYLLLNPSLKEVFNSVPNDKIFLETDLIEEDIKHIYNIAANYKSIELIVLQKIVKSNFLKVFDNNKNLIKI